MAQQISTAERNIGVIAPAVHDLQRKCVNEVTLTANQTTTTVSDPVATALSFVGLIPKPPPTANALAAVSTTYVSAVSNGGFTITHASDASTDRTFRYFIWN